MKEIEPGNVTMLATDDIKEGEEVAYVPPSFQILPAAGRQSGYYKQFAEVEGLKDVLDYELT